MQKKDSNPDIFFIEKFKNSCFELENNLQIYQSKVKIRNEVHTIGNSKEIIFEIIVLHLINEDDYGVVFSLNLEYSAMEDIKSIELSALRGNGVIMQVKRFDVMNSEFAEGDYIEYLNELKALILVSLENEYLKIDK